MEALIVLWIKWTGLVKIKCKDFIDTVPIMPCQNVSWIMSFRIYGERRTQIPMSSTATIGHVQGSTIDRVYTDINIASNTKINNIMVSFSDHYTAISIYLLPQKLKLEEILATVIIPFYVSPSSTQLQRLLLFYLKQKQSLFT